MFQKDYWKMSDDELKELAAKYHMPTNTKWDYDSKPIFDRNMVIDSLVLRDNTIRAARVAWLALIISVLSIVLSTYSVFFKK